MPEQMASPYVSQAQLDRTFPGPDPRAFGPDRVLAINLSAREAAMLMGCVELVRSLGAQVPAGAPTYAELLAKFDAVFTP